jgi:hypothetical protein
MNAYRTDRPKIAIRCVCARCNNGWMSQLQERGKPLIERLWSDNACTLDLEECLSLSVWAVMTSMVLHCAAAGLLGRNRVANLAAKNRSGSVAPAFGNPS